MRITRLVFIVLFAAFSLSAQQFKSIIQLKESLMNLKDVCFINSDTGFAVGQSYWDLSTKDFKSTLISTFDKGAHWNLIDPGSGLSLNAINCVGKQYLWAVGDRGILLRSVDGGKIWNSSTIDSYYNLTGIYFIDQNNGWAIGEKKLQSDTSKLQRYESMVWFSQNGGSSWTPQDLPVNAEMANSIKFVGKKGWISGTIHFEGGSSGAVFTTSNGGTDWMVQFSAQRDMVLNSVDFCDSLNGWVGGYNLNGTKGNVVFNTTDGGTTWSSQNDTDEVYKVKFIDKKKGYISGLRLHGTGGPLIMRTTNGGASWDEIPAKHTGEAANGLWLSAERFVVVGDRDFVGICADPWNNILDATKAALKVDQIGKRYSFNGIYFSDSQHGWVTGTNIWFDRGTQIIMHTSDGGNTWIKMYEPRDTICPNLFGQLFSRLKDIISFDNGACLAIGNRRSQPCDPLTATVVYSPDNGFTWQIKQGLSNVEFLALHKVNRSTAWLLPEQRQTSSFKLYVTKDYGNSFKEVNTNLAGSTVSQGDIFFLDSLHGWVAGGNGFVIATTDGGDSWAKVNILPQVSADTLGSIFSVCFSSLTHGWVAGQNLYETKDGGKTWSKRDIGFIWKNIHSINFTSENVGWLAGAYGVIMRTTDGGVTWDMEEGTRTNFQAVNAISFVNDTTGWTCGDAGTIMYVTTNPTPVISSSKKTLKNDLKTFVGNGKLIVNMNLPAAQTVRLDLVDLSGRTVVKYNKQLTSGSHMIAFDVRDLRYGIYIMRSREPSKVRTSVIHLGM
jgi:photosystem II stability/assembly factor-like uncharacterized protein